MHVRAVGRTIAGCAGATLALAFVPRPLAHAVLAATAGTLFEAAPFVVLAQFVPARLRGLARLGGCGCGGRGEPPGALAPVAFAVCWLSFGPAVAIARAAVAALPAVARRASRRARAFASGADGKPETLPEPSGGGRPPPPVRDRQADMFATLRGLAVSSAATALLAPHLGRPTAEPFVAAAAGLVLGTIVPCATAGVAVAAGCASRNPWLAAGVLATAGIVPHLRLPLPAPTARPPEAPRFPLLLLAAGLAAVAARDGAGLVNPRLVPLAVLAAVAATVLAVGYGPPVRSRDRRTGPRDAHGGPATPGLLRAAAAPALMLAGLIAGSPQPPYAADETSALDGFPGEPVTFTGSAHADGNATRLVRFSITCCRLDATALALTLDRRLAVRDGAWVRVTGRFALRDGRVVVHPDGAAPVAEPADPFVYR